MIVIVVLIGIGEKPAATRAIPQQTQVVITVAHKRKQKKRPSSRLAKPLLLTTSRLPLPTYNATTILATNLHNLESGKEFVIVTVQITNNSDSTLDYNTFEFKMQDSNGVQQNEAITALSEGKLNSGSLAKGGKVTGKLAYEVPKDDAGLKLLYQNFSFFDNKAITFNLQ